MTDTQRIVGAVNLISQILASKPADLTSDLIWHLVNASELLMSASYGTQREDFPEIVRRLEQKFVTTMDIGISLIDPNVPHNENWAGDRPFPRNYWKDYEQYLFNQGLPPKVVTSIDAVTDKILGQLQDPTQEDEWDRRGLVIGHVQSGKTANYIGLLSKAADAGYRLIIVIAGIHNNLRTQTQERIDAGFIGMDSDSQKPIGVGLLNPKRTRPATVTTTRSDFNKTVAKQFQVQIKDIVPTFIVVVKKNASTLSSLYDWLKLQTQNGSFSNLPMLMIDDEADNASVNTNQEDLDPTRINREIRRILRLFRRKCFVGYTATPFANIFINPDDDDESLGKDLFPESFIYCLDAPTNYFGADRIFSPEDQTSQFIRIIDDAEPVIPVRHKGTLSVDWLPGSLEEALLTFVLARTVRNLRGQASSHCSMMVNISRFMTVQRDLSYVIRAFIAKIRSAVEINHALSPDRAARDPIIARLRDTYARMYADAPERWENVLRQLHSAVSAVKILVVNSQSDERLDYSAYTREGNSLTAIVIGGLSLSRGLTIEGLTVTYMYRNTQMYDTLMQMGRWFGYRDGYEDLCRIYMSADSYRWYSHIAEATEELRQQIKRMRRDGKKPSDFGLYVRAHPDTLLVTARNKMRSTETKDLVVSYDGKLLETHIIPESPSRNQENIRLFEEFFAYLFKQRSPVTDDSSSVVFYDLSWETVHDFLQKFRFHGDLFDLSENIPGFVKEIQDLYPMWDVSLRSVDGHLVSNVSSLGLQRRSVGVDASGNIKKPESEPGWYTGNKNRFSGNSMFAVGLSENQIKTAKELAESEARRQPIFRDYTNARKKPILICHMLELTDRDKNPIIRDVPAISVSFPNSSEFRTVSYVVNQVWLQKYYEQLPDSQAEEDDDDSR